MREAKTTLIEKILASQRLLQILHEDEAHERHFFERYLEHELQKDAAYLQKRLNSADGEWLDAVGPTFPQSVLDAIAISDEPVSLRQPDFSRETDDEREDGELMSFGGAGKVVRTPTIVRLTAIPNASHSLSA